MSKLDQSLLLFSLGVGSVALGVDLTFNSLGLALIVVGTALLVALWWTLR